LIAILVRGLPVAAVTVPAGVLVAAIPSRPGRAVTPEWTEQDRRARARAEARTRRRAERLSSSPKIAASDALGVALGDVQLPSWRRGPLIVPPAGQLGLTTLLVGGPGTGKTTAAERIAELAATERRQLCVIDGKGTDGLTPASAHFLSTRSTSGEEPRNSSPTDWSQRGGSPRKPRSTSRQPCSASAWP
jgi:hypothetical protein